MNFEQKEKLYSAALWGAGGVGAAAILMDLFRSHKRRRAASEGKEEDALNLYMPAPGNSKRASAEPEENLKEAGINNLLIASMLAGGTFYGTNALYKKWRKGQLEKELEDSAGQYLSGIQESMQPPGMKLASGGVASTDPADIAKAILLLSFIAGGAGTYGILENTFPSASEKPKAGTPRKIVVKGFGTVHSNNKADGRLAADDRKRQTDFAKPKEEEKEKPEAEPKERSFNYGPKDQQKAAAYTALICAGRETENSPLAALMGRILMDKSAAGLVKDLHDSDFLGAISASGGCHRFFKSASEGAKIAAAMTLFGSRELRPSAATLLVGEMNDFNPEATALAKLASQDYSTSVVATKLASTLLQNEGTPPDPAAVKDSDPWLSDFYDDEMGGLEGGDAEGNEKAEGDEGVDPVEEALEELTPFQGAI